MLAVFIKSWHGYQDVTVIIAIYSAVVRNKTCSLYPGLSPVSLSPSIAHTAEILSNRPYTAELKSLDRPCRQRVCAAAGIKLNLQGVCRIIWRPLDTRVSGNILC